MPEPASTRFGVDAEPVVASRSLWRKLTFARLNLVGNLAAEAVSTGQGGGPPTALAGTRIVIRETASGKEVWQVAASDITGGASPEQLLDNIQHDLEALSVDRFAAKWGLSIPE